MEKKQMYNKGFLFLLIFHFNSTLIAMDNHTSEWHLQKELELSRWVSSVCIDPTEQLLGIVFCDAQAHITDFPSGKRIAFLDFSHGITSICFNHDGKKFAALSHKPETYIFDIEKRANSNLSYKKNNSFAHKGAITSIHFDDKNNLCGVESDANNQVHITNLKT